MSEYFLEPESFGRRMNVKLGFSTTQEKQKALISQNLLERLI